MIQCLVTADQISCEKQKISNLKLAVNELACEHRASQPRCLARAIIGGIVRSSLTGRVHTAAVEEQLA